MTRAKTSPISQPSAIQPTASPVDTYVRPAEPSPSPLHDLAKGLASFDAGLGAFLDKRQGQRNAADEVRAQAAFNKNNQVGWAEAVKRGLVPANASPVFMKSYKAAQGNLQGIKVREEFNKAYLTWEGRNANDPEAFQMFLGDYLKSSIGTDDPEVLAGLMPHIQALTADGFETFGTDSAKQIYNGSVNTRAAIAGETIDWADKSGLATGDGTDYGAVREDLEALREEALGSGIAMADFDKQLVDTIRDKAVEHGDPELLNLLDEVWPGYDVKLSSVPEFRDIKSAGLTALEQRARQQMADLDRKAIADDKKAVAVLSSSVARIITADPTAPIPEELIKEWEKRDGMARKKIADIRKSLVSGDQVEDPRDLLLIERMVQDGLTVEEALELAGEDGPINDVATLKNVIDRVEKRKKASAEGTGILTTSSAKNFIATIKERTLPEQNFAWEPAGMTDEGLEARRDFEVMLMDWDTRNPDASQMEREEATNKIGELILKRIDPEEREYTSQEDATRMKADEAAAAIQEDIKNAQPPQEASEAPVTKERSFRDRFREAMEIDAGISRPREADKEAYKAWHDAETAKIYANDEPPSLNDMDNSYRRRLEADAKRLGMEPEEFNMKMWKSIREAIGGVKTDPKPEGDGVDTTTTGSISPTQSSTPPARQTATILDTLGGAEGTDRGRGYNETLAYGKFTGGPVDLVNMTLGEIDQLQTEMLKHPDNDLNSSALGRYQIVQRTLKDMKKKLKLTDDMKFTPKLQDDIADALLERRGFSKWQSGKITDDTFMNNIAKEWASLPTTEGTSYYGGDARITTEALRTAFSSNRAVAVEQARDVFSKVLTDQKSPDSDIVALGYAEETNGLRDGIAGAIDAVVNPKNGRKVSSIEVASQYLGMDDRKSKEAKTLGAFIKKASGLQINPATTAWCAAFANAVLGSQGLEGTGKLNARSFLNWGQKVTTPAKGDVVVLWRESPSSWKGHVGFFDGIENRKTKDGGTAQYIRMLGGNQGSSAKVSINYYPVSRVLGYRRPKDISGSVAAG